MDFITIISLISSILTIISFILYFLDKKKKKNRKLFFKKSEIWLFLSITFLIVFFIFGTKFINIQGINGGNNTNNKVDIKFQER